MVGNYYISFIKHIIYILLLLISFNGVAQEFADKEYYLVDSLVLEELSETDKLLIDSCLKVFHQTTKDTAKLNVINIIIQKSSGINVYPKYNEWRYVFIKKKMSSKNPTKTLKHLKRSLAKYYSVRGYIYRNEDLLELSILNYEKSLKVLNEIDDERQAGFIYYRLALVYKLKKDYSSAIKYFQKHISIMSKLGDKIEMAHSYNDIAVIYSFQGDTTLTIKNYYKCLKLREENDDFKGVADTYSNLGIIYYKQGNFKSAKQCYLKSLDLRKRIGNMHGVISCFSDLGAISKTEGNVPLAIDYYQKALETATKLGDDQQTSWIMLGLGDVQLSQGELDLALEYYDNSLKLLKGNNSHFYLGDIYTRKGKIYTLKKKYDIALKQLELSLFHKEKTGDKYLISESLINIGVVYEAKQELNEALKFYNKSLTQSKILQHKFGLADSYYKIANIQLQLNLIGLAKDNGELSLIYAEELGAPELVRNSAEVLGKIYEKQGKGMKALEMYKLHVQMKDSINNETTQKAAIRQQTQYEFEKAQIIKENEAKEEARVLAEATGRRDNIQYSLIFLGILVLFGIVLSLGFIKVSPTIAEGIIFFAFLILFEFVLVFTEPYLEQYTNGEPMYNLLANAVIALLIFPLHDKLETVLKKRIVK